MMNLFLKIYEKLWKEATRIAPGLFKKTGDEE